MPHVVAGLIEILKGLLLCAVFSLSGGFLTFAFSRPHRLLLSPSCGLAVIAVGMSFFYGFVHLSFAGAAIISATLGSVGTLAAIAINRPTASELKRALLMLFAASIASVLLPCPAPWIAGG